MADNKSYYSDDAIKAKLSSLNEAQDVIVNVAQWLLFNKRNAVRTAELWMQRVKDSQPAKRLSLVYLANEVVQQSKARKKEEFVNAFAPVSDKFCVNLPTC
jgi:regulator of Ty1 transposition protein 103